MNHPLVSLVGMAELRFLFRYPSPAYQDAGRAQNYSDIIYLAFCLSVCLFVCLSFVFLAFCLSVFLSVFLSVWLSGFLAFCLSVFLFVCPSVRLSVRPSVRSSVYASVHPFPLSSPSSSLLPDLWPTSGLTFLACGTWHPTVPPYLCRSTCVRRRKQPATL